MVVEKVQKWNRLHPHFLSMITCSKSGEASIQIWQFWAMVKFPLTGLIILKLLLPAKWSWVFAFKQRWSVLLSGLPALWSYVAIDKGLILHSAFVYLPEWCTLLTGCGMAGAHLAWGCWRWSSSVLNINHWVSPRSNFCHYCIAYKTFVLYKAWIVVLLCMVLLCSVDEVLFLSCLFFLFFFPQVGISQYCENWFKA